ncbi:MAG: DUF4382 domain-containing protein [Ferruginibacter sp.]
MKKNISILAAILLAGSVAFISCKKDNAAGTSTLNVRLTDAPTAYEEVNVDIREVRVKFSDDSLNTGWVTLVTTPGIYRLLDLQNGVDTLLATGVFPFQTVKEIRFVLGPNNTIKDAGVVYPLTVPSGAESGLKLKISKDLNETLETIIIDFDAALSVTKEGTGDYKLRPVLRIK